MYLALDLTDLPGTDLLNEDEKELCTSCRLLPVHYLAMKVALMREGLNTDKPLTRNRVRTMFKVDPLKAVRVYELLLQHGWVLQDGFTNLEEGEDVEPSSKKNRRDNREDDDDEEGEQEEENGEDADEPDYETDDNGDEDEDEEEEDSEEADDDDE